MSCVNTSAPGRIRTCDTGFRRAVLYPLSYEGQSASQLTGQGSAQLRDHLRKALRMMLLHGEVGQPICVSLASQGVGDVSRRTGQHTGQLAQLVLGEIR